MRQGKPITLKQARLQALYVGEKAEKRRYGMKPITQWTLEERNHFLTLLMGKCWHEWEEHREMGSYWYQCKLCGVSDSINMNFYADLSRFEIIKSFMEKELPEVWERYLGKHHEKAYYACLYNEDKPFTKGFDAQLDLTNLIIFLLDNQEGWAWKECTACTGNGDISENSIRWGVDKITCPECQGAGKVKHPALLFAEGVK